MAGTTGVLFRVALTGGAATRREADATGRSVKGIGKAAESTAHQTKLAELSMKSMEGTTKRLRKGVGLLLGAAGIGGIASGVRGLVVAASDAQASESKVKNLLENLGISYAKHKKRIDAVIQSQSQLTGLDDEELAESFANMARSTGKVNEALKLNALSADIARSRGMNLAGAQSLVARVYNGAFTGIKRLGIAITPVTVAQDKLRVSGKHYTAQQLARAKAEDKAATSTQAIALLQQKFGGQAAAYGKTAKGSYDRFQVALENVKESLGMGLLPTLTRVGNKTATFLTQLVDGTGAGGRFAKKIEHIKDELTPLGKWLADNRSTILKVAGGFTAIALALQTIKKVGKITGLTGLSKALGRSPLGRALGVATKSDGTITRPFYVVVLDKAPGKGVGRKVLDAAKKVLPAGGAASGFGAAEAAALGASALLPAAGIAYLALHNNHNYRTRGRGASSPSNPAGHVAFDPRALDRRLTTPTIVAPVDVSAIARAIADANSDRPLVVSIDGKEVAHAVTRAAKKKQALK